MRKKIATALVCLTFCLSTNTSTAFAHNHQEVISEVTETNEMMIDDESVINRVKLPKVDILKIDSICGDTIRQQKSNQKTDIVVRRVTYYYPTGNKTSTGQKTRNKKIVSLSPDLLKKIPYHSKVEIVGYGIYTVEDRTSSKLRSTADILLPRGTKIKNGKNVTIRIID